VRSISAPGRRTLRFALWLSAAAVAAVLAFAACGKGKPPAGGSIPLSTASAVTQLQELPCPEGVEQALWEELKDALKEALGKTTSNPPTGNANKIADLSVADNGDGTYTLTWRYRNLGDYDQNGKVAIADISPLAQHFAETWEAGEEDTLPAVIDGSGNGKVGIEDVTQIAMCFGVNLHHYTVQGSHLFNGPFTDVAEVVLPEGNATARVELAYDLGVPPYLNWRVVPYDADGNAGPASNVAVVSEAPPPAVRILSINPLGGVTGAEASFTATVSGEPPLTYSWNFGGGAAPNESAEPSPTVTLGAVNTYQASLRVENAQGSATKNFTLTVTEIPGEPPQIISVSPTEGNSGTEATFSAGVTGDGPLEYSWNFGGGASPNQSADPAPTATLSRGGTLPAPIRTYPATLTVTNPYGADVLAFDLDVSAWWHLIPKPYDDVRANALTPDGKPTLIARRDGTWFYCEYDGTSWNEQVLPLSNSYRELAYNPVTSEPAAVGVIGSIGSQAATYFWRSGGQWRQEKIEYAGWIVGADLAFHQDGAPVVCWGVLGQPFTLKAAERKAGGWVVETVPTEGQDPRDPSMTVDGNDRVAIAYDNGSIWIAREEATVWEMAEVVPAPSGGPEIAMTPDGSLAVIVRRAFAQTTYIAYVEETFSGWNLKDIDTSDHFSLNTVAPGFRAEGEPVIAYAVNIGEQDAPAWEVRVVWRDGGTWFVSVPFPPSGSTASWGGSLVGVGPDGDVVLTVGETGTSNKYIALLW